MEGSCCCCNGSSCVMGFGDNSGSSASCAPNPMMLMMPLLTTTTTSTCHHAHAHPHAPHHPNPINPIPNPINTNNNNNNLTAYYNLPMPMPIPILSSTNTSNPQPPTLNTITNASGLGPLFMDKSNHGTPSSPSSSSSSSSVKAKIMAHPHYHRLLAAYVNCQKVGAPPEAVARLEEACASAATMGCGGGGIGEDPALDQFMEAYCEMLTKYEQELSKPFKEAMHFLHSIECQFKALTISSSTSSDFACANATDRNGSSEEDIDVPNNNIIDPLAEDRELKGQLLRKYSGYLGSLKQEFMKKRKKGKLPKEARQQLLDWWSRHYKWPYPSESQKLALAESTGLDQKQINNWFINQRKRHWKPSEDMQFMVVDPSHPHHHYYMDTVLGNPYPMI